MGFPDGKKCYAGYPGDEGLIPGSGRSPGGGHVTPLQYSCLKNPMDRGAWRAAVHRVTESDTTERLSSNGLEACQVPWVRSRWGHWIQRKDPPKASLVTLSDPPNQCVQLTQDPAASRGTGLPRLGGCTPGAPGPGRRAWQGPPCSGPGLSCLTCLLSTPPPTSNQSFHSSEIIIVIHIIIVIIIIASLA